jgi:hypothetical protein
MVLMMQLASTQVMMSALIGAVMLANIEFQTESTSSQDIETALQV